MRAGISVPLGVLLAFAVAIALASVVLYYHAQLTRTEISVAEKTAAETLARTGQLLTLIHSSKDPAAGEVDLYLFNYGWEPAGISRAYVAGQAATVVAMEDVTNSTNPVPVSAIKPRRVVRVKLWAQAPSGECTVAIVTDKGATFLWDI